MKISRRGLYALKALIHLAESYDKGLVKIHEIADQEAIPEKFLESILVNLKNGHPRPHQPAGPGGPQSPRSRSAAARATTQCLKLDTLRGAL
jgi:hypothetical protein